MGCCSIQRGPSESTDRLSEINRTFAIGCLLFVDYLVCDREHVRNELAAISNGQNSTEHISKLHVQSEVKLNQIKTNISPHLED